MIVNAALVAATIVSSLVLNAVAANNKPQDMGLMPIPICKTDDQVKLDGMDLATKKKTLDRWVRKHRCVGVNLN